MRALRLNVLCGCVIVSDVNIDASTSQSDLMRLTEGALRRRLARALPFHKEGIRGMLLFLLFPGMLFGFRVGLLLTAAVAGAMGATLIFSAEGLGTNIVQSYFVVGAVVSVGVAISIFLQERKRVRVLRSFLKPDADLKLDAGVPAPERQRMDLAHEESGGFRAYFDLYVEKDGVYGFLIDLESYGWATKLMTSAGNEACLFSWGDGQKPAQAICLFRLGSGVHRLQMKVSSEKRKKNSSSTRPLIYLTQLTRS